ncbi:hypothetical protein EWM64_g5684 [Hericium alpestre]|uniref:CxC2-like cysteine cluster KDZ transposase-associated domain-containing protein n=1 Tax=Hericium alpestre TaxID=135208 RepID=A0A4Y9ZY03_9AGAM|nr:hypothetical protein EWM64_g5684 [Hericium alpestre]
MNTRCFNARLAQHQIKRTRFKPSTDAPTPIPYHIPHAAPVTQLSASSDNRRLVTQQTPVPIEDMHASSSGGQGVEEDLRTAELQGVDGVEELDEAGSVVEPGLTARKSNSDYTIDTWKAYCDEYLNESIRLEGRGIFLSQTTCPDCRLEEGSFRCRECITFDLVCKKCMARRHRRTPLHAIEKWNGTFFEHTTLKAAGLVVQLSHLSGVPCQFPELGPSDFVVIHGNGIHHVSINFCGCQLANPIPRRAQLMRAAWWPATPIEPSSAATFSILRQFHMTTLEGKMNATDFYNAITIQTDNTGLKPPPDQLSAFMNMIREWRYIKGMNSMSSMSKTVGQYTGDIDGCSGGGPIHISTGVLNGRKLSYEEPLSS